MQKQDKNATAYEKKKGRDAANFDSAKRASNKKKLQFIISALILIISAAAYFIVKNTEFAEEEKTEEVPVLYVSADEVTGISWENSGGDSLSFTKSGDEWRYDDETERNIDRSGIMDIVEASCDIKSADVIDSPDDLSIYGLSEPYITVTLTLSDGGEKKILIGGQNSLTYDYYIMIDGDPNVYTAESSFEGLYTFDIESLTAPDAATDSEAE